jgi:hypothetical protein
MDDDPHVTPIGARLGSQRLHGGPAPVAKPVVASPPARPAPPPETHPTSGAARATQLASTIVELVGISALTVGCYLILPAIGLIVAGLALILLGIAMSR